MSKKDLFIANQWREGGGGEFASTDPASGDVVWSGHSASEDDVDCAVAAGRRAFEVWAMAGLNQRIEYLQRFGQQMKGHRQDLALTISRETGKPLWESLSEVDAMVAKIDISIEAYRERRSESSIDLGGAAGATRYKPHGVLAVFGPFNMPGHLPNGHIVPALLAGNCVVFKPSEMAPLVGQATVALWEAAGLPAGVVGLVQGGKEVGAMLARHRGLDGVLFTGSLAGGRALAAALLDYPGKILALEMGGNNPLVVWDANDLKAAAYLIVQSAYITSGQRCSCARRLIVERGDRGDALLDELVKLIHRVHIGPFTSTPEPFMGPVISSAAAGRLVDAQANLVSRGGTTLVPMRQGGDVPAMLSPGVVDVTAVSDRPDEELFGPLLQVIRVENFNSAIAEANWTAYGLAAGLLSDDARLWEQFYRRIRAGVVCWNRPTTNASSRLPFGGIGLSGYHRPSGAWAADYCSYPIAIMQKPRLAIPEKLSPGIDP